jgi:hypothetical protein
MSTMNCSRLGCTNILCSRLSQKHGYICHECFQELVATGPTTDIETFLNTRKLTDDELAQAKARYEAAFTPS